MATQLPKAKVTVERPKKRGPVTTDSRHSYAVAPNVLARQFDVEQPDQVWIGDVTYLWTTEGWLYLAVLPDRYSRKVVGWALSHRVDAALVQDALRMALGRRKPAVGLIHHSDHGSQYACGAYQALLAEHAIRCRMSRKGDCLDNAVAERFFGSLKGECTSLHHGARRQEARDAVLAYIEMFYNSKRLHSYLEYLSPNAFEDFTNAA
jgi:putative transposase